MREDSKNYFVNKILDYYADDIDAVWQEVLSEFKEALESFRVKSTTENKEKVIEGYSKVCIILATIKEDLMITDEEILKASLQRSILDY